MEEEKRTTDLIEVIQKIPEEAFEILIKSIVKGNIGPTTDKKAEVSNALSYIQNELILIRHGIDPDKIPYKKYMKLESLARHEYWGHTEEEIKEIMTLQYGEEE